jgi:hypothetical protein
LWAEYDKNKIMNLRAQYHTVLENRLKHSYQDIKFNMKVEYNVASCGQNLILNSLREEEKSSFLKYCSL